MAKLGKWAARRPLPQLAGRAATQLRSSVSAETNNTLILATNTVQSARLQIAWPQLSRCSENRSSEPTTVPEIKRCGIALASVIRSFPTHPPYLLLPRLVPRAIARPQLWPSGTQRKRGLPWDEQGWNEYDCHRLHFTAQYAVQSF